MRMTRMTRVTMEVLEVEEAVVAEGPRRASLLARPVRRGKPRLGL